MKHITTEDALRALEEAVAEKGEDYVYPRAFADGGGDCVYVEWNKANERVPSCIAGNALVRLGVPIEDLVRHNGGVGITALARLLSLPIDDDAAFALAVAQGRQDDGMPWGLAVEAAREEVSGA